MEERGSDSGTNSVVDGTEGRSPSRISRLLPFALCALIAALLSLPGLRFAYVFDDYDFLARGQQFQWAHFLPDSNDIFYRPISRELYFGFLESVSPGDPLVGHAINIGLVVATVLLTGVLVTGLAGLRAGVIASLLLGAFGQWPVLVAWVCGSQDLLAIVFLLLALNSELRGARWEAITLFALAILSKETAVVAAPALIAVAWLRTGARKPAITLASQLGALLFLWLLIHPGVGSLLARGGASGKGSYIGIDNPERWSALLESVPALLNLSITSHPGPWPREFAGILLLSLLPFICILWLMRRLSTDAVPFSDGPAPISANQCLLLGSLISIPTILLTCLLVKHWAPYYACFPAVGMAVAVAPRLARIRPLVLSVVLTLFLIGGVWSRSVELGSGMPTEKGLATAGMALAKVERNFKAVAPALPEGSVVYVTTMATGTQSVYIHIHRFQALRVWYRDPTLQTLRPERHVISSRPEYLFWIDPKLSVFQVDTQTLAVRSAGAPVEPFRYRAVLRSYAIGLAGSGQLQRAVDVLLGIDPPTSWHHVTSYRIAAMLVYAYGFEADANQMLLDAPMVPRAAALRSIRNLLTVPMSPSRPLERHALRAFGLSWDDADAVKAVMWDLDALGYHNVSSRLAERVLMLQPGDPIAFRILEKAKKDESAGGRITPEIPEFEPPG